MSQSTKKLPITAFVLEDDPVDLGLLQWYFGRLERYEVISETADNVQDAVKACIEKNYDLLFCDFWLGSESSLEFIRRTGGGLNGVPIVLITSLPGKDVRQMGFNAGACAFLSKYELSAGTIETAIDTAIHAAGQLSQLQTKVDGSYGKEQVGAMLEDLFSELMQVEQQVARTDPGADQAAAQKIAALKDTCQRLAISMKGETPEGASAPPETEGQLSKPSRTAAHDAARRARNKDVN